MDKHGNSNDAIRQAEAMTDIAKTKAALKPFAKLAQVMPPDFGDDDSIGSNFTIGLLAGHLRRAAEAYAEMEAAQVLIDKPLIEGGNAERILDALDAEMNADGYVAASTPHLKALRNALSPALVKEGVVEDPAQYEQWNDGVDFAQMQLCAVLKIDPKTVTWDAATEEVESDIFAVIDNILTVGFGENWQDKLQTQEQKT